MDGDLDTRVSDEKDVLHIVGEDIWIHSSAFKEVDDIGLGPGEPTTTDTWRRVFGGYISGRAGACRRGPGDGKVHRGKGDVRKQRPGRKSPYTSHIGDLQLTEGSRRGAQLRNQTRIVGGAAELQLALERHDILVAFPCRLYVSPHTSYGPVLMFSRPTERTVHLNEGAGVR